MLQFNDYCNGYNGFKYILKDGGVMGEKILLVEDDVSISEMVENYLIKEGFCIVTAFDGEEGVDKFLKNSFDLVILDIMMPKLDGMEVMKIIRDKEYGSYFNYVC